MKEPRRPAPPGPTKPDPSSAEEKENVAIDTDHLLEEVEEANAEIPNPAERERVIPSRPC
ncbi:MAG TPA: hypothetical protein VFL19_04985 [Nitrospira sp.]|nr:hypothetical protein [Nitrospira sp.]